MSISKVIKSISDKRIYRPLSLQNNLECLVISDQDAQKSAAALSVGVGSLQDPKEAQGLAHYLEHMLFMGTEKYPEENEYSNVLLK
jgi:secreted Zn-dependent insulinase-like peptidase